MSYDQDSTLTQLQHRIQILREQRNTMMNDLIAERKQVQLMQNQLTRMKKQKQYIDGLIKQKTAAERQYDRIIMQSEKTLFKLSQNTKKLLLSVDNQYGKYLHQ